MLEGQIHADVELERGRSLWIGSGARVRMTAAAAAAASTAAATGWVVMVMMMVVMMQMTRRDGAQG